MPVSFGIKTSQISTSYVEVLRIWREAEEIDAFDSAWLWDHLVPMRGDVTAPALEAWTLLAALAAMTRRLRLGVIVTSNRIRPPALLAKMAATVDQIAGGRLVLGIGAGYARSADPTITAIAEREYGAHGIDVVPVREAIDALAEALTIIRRLWTEAAPFDFAGAHYQLAGAICEPKPTGPLPILIGAGGERRSLRLVAEHADIWNCPTRGDIDAYLTKSRILDEHCAVLGRDPAAIARQVQILVGSDPADAAETREHIRALINAGATEIVLTPLPPWPDRLPARLAEEIIAPLL
ncbi:LLM class flavin-dependent oxidoreductase [Conexibacter sp. DBS9H8]|uniref:LLM class flavin-dependent oxidoreductase n=1 Tax=Conexibacter sp. DBS9H8 TaxID=2937801 RepID=UPI00200EB3DE|nr:LLM class flavin-dependent oxidoreductase [Conexibacter sp. DBS9H8]